HELWLPTSASPVPEKDLPLIISAFDHKYYVYAYLVQLTTAFVSNHILISCNCNPNYYNLLNTSVFPCY
ncbi:hypothetical protein S245_018947, partial [Arachis hypogaea]